MIFTRPFIFVLTILLSGSLSAQQWAVDGTIWTFEEKYFVSSKRTPVHFFVAGDTLINNQTYKRIEADKDGFFYFPGNGKEAFTYENSGKVYLYDHTRDTNTILYDFNAEVGDSWVVRWDTCQQEVRVDSVDSLQAKGEWLKRLHVSGYYEYDGPIVEGIGHTTQLFSPEWFYYSCDPGVVVDGKFIWGLRCFEQFGFGQWNTGLVSSCNVVISGIEENTNRHEIKISPNPTSDLVQIDLPVVKEWHLEIFGMNGRQLKSVTFTGNQHTLSTTDWAKGLYLLRVKIENGETWTTKIMKQ